MNIKAVVFDYGGVICFPPSQENLAELEKLTGLDQKTLWELNRKNRGEWDRGTFNGIDYYRHILSGAGIFPDDNSLEEITLTDMEGWKRINSETVQLMHDLKAAGLTIGICSNMPNDFYSWAKDELPVFMVSHVNVISCSCNIIKPEIGIFELLQKQINFEFGEIVFFDDFADNVAAARGLGMKSFIWEGADAARKMIETSLGKKL